MAQLVKRRTFDLSSGHDLAVHGIQPCIGLYVDSTERARDSLPLPLSLPLLPSLARTLSLSLNKNK